MTAMRRFRQAERTAARVIDGSAYVIAVDGQFMLELNEVGTLVWERLAQPATVEDLVASVESEFDVSPEPARRDVESFLSTLLERGVVAEEPPAT
jgi:hypothetical protein